LELGKNADGAGVFGSYAALTVMVPGTGGTKLTWQRLVSELIATRLHEREVGVPPT
jgi:hypothetical protein